MTQLELFDGAGAPVASPRIAQNGAETAAQDVPGVSQAPSKAGGRAGAALAPAGVPIPARCPVTGGRICYRDGCHYYRHRQMFAVRHGHRLTGPAVAGPSRRRLWQQAWVCRCVDPRDTAAQPSGPLPWGIACPHQLATVVRSGELRRCSGAGSTETVLPAGAALACVAAAGRRSHGAVSSVPFRYCDIAPGRGILHTPWQREGNRLATHAGSLVEYNSSIKAKE